LRLIIQNAELSDNQKGLGNRGLLFSSPDIFVNFWKAWQNTIQLDRAASDVGELLDCS
jgi:hypothetical protein